MAERPELCVDNRCEPFFCDFDKEHFEKGYSFSCVGKLAEPHEFKWREIIHKNTHSHCVYTPLKGISRFLITPEDAWSTYVMMAQILKIAMPLQCDGCGETDRVGEGYMKVDERHYCHKCCVRLGILEWDGERYIYKGRKERNIANGD